MSATILPLLLRDVSRWEDADFDLSGLASVVGQYSQYLNFNFLIAVFVVQVGSE